MDYDLIVTAVSDRADLFAQSMASLLAHVDAPPDRILVHEDIRPNTTSGGISKWLRGCGIPYQLYTSSPPKGMGLGMLRLLELARTPIVLYTQEDWLVLRDIPVQHAINLMQKHNIHHIRWNKRDTMPCKHEGTPMQWDKVEVQFDGQTMCISDHWYTQTSLWRVQRALKGVRVAARSSPNAHNFVGAFNGWMNKAHGIVPERGDSSKWNDQNLRHKLLRTYIWGGIDEKQYIKHIGSTRGTGVIKNHLKEL